MAGDASTSGSGTPDFAKMHPIDEIYEKLVELQFTFAKKEARGYLAQTHRVIVETSYGRTMNKVGGVLPAGIRTKRFWYGAILAGAVVGLAPNTQAQPPAAEAPDARAAAPGVADKRGRVINPLFRKEKYRAAPIDRGIDADAVAPSKPKAPAAQTPPPVVVTPNPSKGSSGR